MDRVWTSFTKNGRSTRTRKEANVVSELPSFIISIRYMGDKGWGNVKESPFYRLLRMGAAKLTRTGLSCLFHQTERLVKETYDTFATDVSSKSSKASFEASG